MSLDLNIGNCIECGGEPIEANGRCASCNHAIRKESRQQAKDSLKKHKPIKKFSEKRKVENKTYKLLRDAFLKTHYYCQAKLEGCTYKAVDCHHASGRTGEKLNDVTKFIACCRNCHDAIHRKLSAKKARELGLKL